MSRADLRAAFEAQARHCEALGSPFMARLMPLIPAALPDGALLERLAGWPGDVGHRADAVPLRLAGGLHALVLRGEPLSAAYPPHEVPDAALSAALTDAMTAHEDHLLRWLDGPPQTNEVRRAAALVAGAQVVAARFGLPMEIAELGASAGLNLGFPRFALVAGERRFGPPDAALVLTPDWSGPPPPEAVLDVRDRRGVDLAPVDPTDPADRERLLAYLWPDQPDRLARTRAAIALAPVRPEAGDAAPWLARRLARAGSGALHAVYTTVAAQYFPDATRAAIAESFATAGAAATPDAPLLYLAMEADGQAPGAGLTATLWKGGAPLQVGLGRAAFHVDWIDWRPVRPEKPLYPLVSA